MLELSFLLMKNGCSVIIILDMFANITLPPYIIFTAIFGAKLMKEYKDMTKATVLFTEIHWMTSAANMYILNIFLIFIEAKNLVLYMIMHPVIVVNMLMIM